MAQPWKDRAEHRGMPAPHLGQDHYEKSRIDAAAGPDNGPTFASATRTGEHHDQPQLPADDTYRAQQAIEKGSQSNQDRRPKALEKAVEDLDNGLSAKPG